MSETIYKGRHNERLRQECIMIAVAKDDGK